MTSRDTYRAIAEQNLAAFKAGGFATPDGAWHSLQPRLSEAIQSTVVTTAPTDSGQIPLSYSTGITIADAETLDGLDHLRDHGVLRPGILNFASARSPGGGFLRGGAAQEEYLCRSTTLYPVLAAQTDYYQRNSDWPDTRYADICLHSHNIQRIRDDYGHLQAPGSPFGVITAAAPNRRAAREKGLSDKLARDFDGALAMRIDLILHTACHVGHDGLVLGAWGCGVFGNDPITVAGMFQSALTGKYAGAFRHVVFAVPSRFDQVCFDAFASVFDRA